MKHPTVEVNDLLQLKLPDDPNSLPFQSRVEDVVEGCLVIAWPSDRGAPIPIHPDRPLSLSFVRGNVGYVFAAKVQEKGLEPFPYLKVHPLGPPKRIQRREFFRMKIGIEVELAGVVVQPFNRETVVYLKSQTFDLSGGGMAIRSEASIPVGTVLEAKLVLLDGLPPIKFMARVVQTQPVLIPDREPLSHIGMSFTEIKEADRKRIIRYLFRSQMNQLVGSCNEEPH